MTSRRQGRLGLLISVRYQNPIPPPPYPPKLIDIPTPIEHYGSSQYHATLAQGRSQPMSVDIEGGMPVDLTGYDGMFDLNGDHSPWCPDPSQEDTVLDPEDAALLKGGSGKGLSAIGMGNGTPSRQAHGAAPGAAKEMITSTGRAEVSWLRRTQYLSNATASPRHGPPTPIPATLAQNEDLGKDIDISSEAQVATIEQSFSSSTIPLDQLRHPTKSHIKAVESYPLLPDDTVWGHPFRIIRLPENPSSRRDAQADQDQRPEHALFQPIQEAETGSRYMSYYLAEEDQFEKLQRVRHSTEEAIKQNLPIDENDESEESEIRYRWIRDYDYVKLPAELEDANYMAEVFFALRHGDPSKGEPEGSIAAYSPAEGRTQLKKRRVRRDEILSIQKSSDHVDAYHVRPRSLRKAELRSIQALSMELMTDESQMAALSQVNATSTKSDPNENPA